MKTGLKVLFPVLFLLGIFFASCPTIIDLSDFFERRSTKVTCPTSYEFKIYDRLLRKYVKNGRVDYQSLRNDPEWKACCVELKETSPSRLQGKLEQLSFWINTYNLLTIKCVADSYPLARLSRESAERKFTVGGKPYSLAQIKEEIFPPLISTSDWRAIFLVCDGTTGAPAIVSHA